MTDKFKAVVINQSGEKFSRDIKELDKSFFKTGDVLVKVEFSSLNYKDALILKNGARLVKEYPHIPGIDFSGKVVESDNSNYNIGDDVILTIGNETLTIPLSNLERGDVIDINDFYKKGSTVESETIKLLRQKLETTQNEYNEFRKTILDSKKYQLKNSIPKIECPPCISPKVNVDAALCKKCPPIPEPLICDDDNNNNKSKPACVNKYTVITRNIYKNGKNSRNNSRNNLNILVESEEMQNKQNYNK